VVTLDDTGKISSVTLAEHFPPSISVQLRPGAPFCDQIYTQKIQLIKSVIWLQLNGYPLRRLSCVLKPGVHDTPLFINLGKLSIYLEREERDYGRYVDVRLLQAES
jgi:hypothetical protein